MGKRGEGKTCGWDEWALGVATRQACPVWGLCHVSCVSARGDPSRRAAPPRPRRPSEVSSSFQPPVWSERISTNATKSCTVHLSQREQQHLPIHSAFDNLLYLALKTILNKTPYFPAESCRTGVTEIKHAHTKRHYRCSTYSTTSVLLHTWIRCPGFVAYATADCRPLCLKPGENVAHAGARVGARPAHSAHPAPPVLPSSARLGLSPARF